MKRVKVRCYSCGRPYRKMAKDRYHAWNIKWLRDNRQSVEMCNQCSDETQLLVRKDAAERPVGQRARKALAAAGGGRR